MRLIDADKLILSLNDNYLANSPIGNETLEVKNYREAMCERLKIAMATVEGAPTVGGWISVNDRLPEKETLVIALVQYEVGWYRIFAWRDDKGWASSAEEFQESDGDYVTHWMPLPERPKEDGNESD